MLNFEHNGQHYEGWTATAAAESGVPPATIGAAIKRVAIEQVDAFADSYRTRIAARSAGKIEEYRIKADVAASPDTASAAELDLLSREAKARGTNRTGLIGQINARAAAHRQVTLLIAAIEAETKAAVHAIADDAPDVEAQISMLLAAAKAEAEAEFKAALALMAGG